MQGVGVLLLAISAYLLYSGVTSIRPLPVLNEIIKDPSQASTIIKGAVKAAADSKAVIPDSTILAPVGTGEIAGSAITIGSNPYAGYSVTAPYGQAGHAGTFGSAHVHKGIDYAVPDGTSLASLIPGTFSTSTGGLGGNIAIVSGTGKFAGWKVYYDHTKRFIANDGASVKIGQIIALSGGAAGDPGRGDATGAHLHLEIHHHGLAVNPATFFTWEKANEANLKGQQSADSRAGVRTQ